MRTHPRGGPCHSPFSPILLGLRARVHRWPACSSACWVRDLNCSRLCESSTLTSTPPAGPSLPLTPSRTTTLRGRVCVFQHHCKPFKSSAVKSCILNCVLWLFSCFFLFATRRVARGQQVEWLRWPDSLMASCGPRSRPSGLKIGLGTHPVCVRAQNPTRMEEGLWCGIPPGGRFLALPPTALPLSGGRTPSCKIFNN